MKYFFVGGLVQSHIVPFRMTPNLTKFITPYRKYQMINCLTATGQCLINSIEDISVVLKLLLKDEFNTNFNVSNQLACSLPNIMLNNKLRLI